MNRGGGGAVPQLERCSRGAKFLSGGALTMLTTILSYCRFGGAKFVFGGRRRRVVAAWGGYLVSLLFNYQSLLLNLVSLTRPQIIRLFKIQTK